jgi:phenylalanyl-tRNA synthetase beta chain
MRSISNVVDVTNYVMHVWGSPLHAFDRTKLANGRILVRRARPGEELRTLDGTLRRLDADDLLITDGERAVALAAIMGGEDSEVTQDTREVLLEAANFEPLGILRSSERLALRTAGSNRWEKGVDPYLAPQAAALATELIVELAGAEWAGDTDAVGQLPERPVVSLRTDRVNRTVGLEIAPEEQRGALERLGFGVGDDWSVTVPTWRAIDVNREIDLVEEVARVNGLEKIPFTLPLRSAMFGRLAPDQRLRRLVEDVLVGVGFFEAYTLSLTSSDRDETALRLPDPLTSEHAVLRTTLLSGLIAAARHNMNMANEGIRLFEIARVYLPGKDELPQERRRVGAIAEGGFAVARGAVETLFAALKIEPRLERAEEPFLHPGKAARVQSGWVGELHPTLLEGEWGVFELDLETLLELLPERLVYEDVITFPALRQDLAFVVGEDVAAGDLVAAAKEAGGPELRHLTVFDVYRGEGIGDGKKSIAFHAEFRSPERTLSDDDARILREKIVAALGAQFAAELRA